MNDDKDYADEELIVLHDDLGEAYVINPAGDKIYLEGEE